MKVIRDKPNSRTKQVYHTQETCPKLPMETRDVTEREERRYNLTECEECKNIQMDFLELD